MGPVQPAPAAIPPEQAMPYRLLVAGQGDALAREQIVKAVQAAFAARGLRPTVAAEDAELVVTLDLKVGPLHDGPVGESEPIYDVTPGKEEYESVTLGIGGNGGTLYDTRKVKQPDIVIYQGERPVMLHPRLGPRLGPGKAACYDAAGSEAGFRQRSRGKAWSQSSPAAFARATSSKRTASYTSSYGRKTSTLARARPSPIWKCAAFPTA